MPSYDIEGSQDPEASHFEHYSNLEGAQSLSNPVHGSPIQGLSKYRMRNNHADFAADDEGSDQSDSSRQWSSHRNQDSARKFINGE